MDTNKEFEAIMAECRELFAKKLHDYGASWRILRPSSLTDQLFIKAKRIRSLEIKKESKVGEGIRPEFIALINYGIVGLIQTEKGFADTVERARGRVEEYLAGKVLEKGSSAGAKFSLQHNCGWKERQEISLDERTAEAVSQKMTLQESIELLKSLGLKLPGEETEENED